MSEELPRPANDETVCRMGGRVAGAQREPLQAQRLDPVRGGLERQATDVTPSEAWQDQAHEAGARLVPLQGQPELLYLAQAPRPPLRA